MRIVAVLFIALAMAGCASQPLYDWGGYDQLLYKTYKEPAEAKNMKAALEAHIAAVDQGGESSQRRLPPGIYAELGTLYLQEGAVNEAIALYKRERDAWPESRGLMDAMIANLERSQTGKGGAKP